MIINYTINKKNLENIINRTFFKFGYIASSFLLDSLKLLSFYYATNSGISISIEDLKTPKIKNNLIFNADKNVNKISDSWKKGMISKDERFQNILYNWNNVTEILKIKIINYYKKFNPTNNLYLMAFSGARGNISQVSQLIGVRGLMADQDGKTINVPINTNFREGLSSTDYIISSYGARKGIVDTALKTATSGYLTRRLIYATKNLIIRQLDCKSKNGIIIYLNSKSNFNKILGNYLNYMIIESNNNNIILKDTIIDYNVIKYIKNFNNIILNIRSITTCNSNSLICQKCYGWDLSKKQYISLGETVGITAAQSISEPGTQLTMRTFHTGGVFSTNQMEKTKANFSGKLIISDLLKLTSYRIQNGNILYKLNQDTILKLINWKGIIQNIYLKKDSLLYFNKNVFIKKNQIVAENFLKSTKINLRKLKLIFSNLNGQIYFNNLLIKYSKYNNKYLKINKKEGFLWIKSNEIIKLPKIPKYKILKNKVKNFNYGKLYLIAPFNGFIKSNKNQLNFFNKNKKINIYYKLNKEYKNYKLKYFSLVKDYQNINKNSIIGFYKFISYKYFKNYSLKNKKHLINSKLNTFLLITKNKNIFKLNLDQINNNSFYIIKYIKSNFINNKFLLKKNGLKLIYQKSEKFYLKNGSIINYNNNQFIYNNNIVAKLSNYLQESKDIIQGLPKIDELIEARHPNLKSILHNKPGILMNFNSLNSYVDTKYLKNIFHLKYKYNNFKLNKILINILNNNDNNIIKKYKISSYKTLINTFGNFINLSKPLTIGIKDPHELLNILFNYHILLDGLYIGLFKSLNKFQLIFTNSIQSIYQSQGVFIINKHIELIIKNITSKVIILNKGNTYFLPNELIKISLLSQIYKIYVLNKKLYDIPTYKPKLVSIKNYSLNSNSFISNASFQQTKKILTKAAIEGNKDWLNGLKESIILGRPIPAGSTFLNYKNNLDNIFIFKN